MDGFTNSQTKISSNIQPNIKTENIFILAGGQIKNGSINNWVKKRLDLGLQIVSLNETAIIYCIGGGTYHKPPILNIHKHVIHESRSCSNYLINKGFNAKRIKREWASYDTIANGFFSFLNFILPLKLEECVIVTSEFHMERTKEIFNFFCRLFKSDVKVQYICSENEMDEELLQIRKGREKKSLDSFKNTIVSRINTIQEFMEWFYIEHNAYNNEKYVIESTDDNVLESY
jgi:hypothetical protein